MKNSTTIQHLPTLFILEELLSSRFGYYIESRPRYVSLDIYALSFLNISIDRKLVVKKEDLKSIVSDEVLRLIECEVTGHIVEAPGQPTSDIDSFEWVMFAGARG